MVSGLYRLQIVNGEEYSERAGTRSNKTIVLKGSRGMITDAEGVILAKSEKIYNVTFQRDNSQSSSSQYKAFTQAILDTIEILKKYDCDISVTFDDDFYALPNSVHEWLVLPAKLVDTGGVKELNEIIREVNNEQVPEEEQLSDKAYFYNRLTGTFEVAKE